jgi:hypothetical protein
MKRILKPLESAMMSERIEIEEIWSIDGQPSDYDAGIVIARNGLLSTHLVPTNARERDAIAAIRQQQADIEALKELASSYAESVRALHKERDQLRVKLSDTESRMQHQIVTLGIALDAANSKLAESRSQIADMTACALKNIPADWRPGYAWTDDCVMNVLSEYVVATQERSGRAEAKLAEYERAPAVAFVIRHVLGSEAMPNLITTDHATAKNFCFWPNSYTVQELIARPTGDAK